MSLTDAVRDAVRRTLAALPTDEAPGRLTREPAPVGFSLLTGIKPRPIDVPQGQGEGQASKKARKRSEKRRKAAEAQARKEEEKARKEKEKREREIEKAEQALREAEPAREAEGNRL